MNVTNKHTWCNFAYLLFLKIISRVTPLVMNAYMLRVVGFESFGEIGLAMSVSYFATYVISYGFQYTIPSYIILSDDKKDVGRLLTSVVSIQLILVLLCCTLYYVVIYSTPLLYRISKIIWGFFGVSIVSGMFPIGAFQGINKLWYLSVLNPLMKMIFYVLLLLFIHSERDIVYYPILLCAVDFIRLVCGFVLLYVSGITFCRPRISIIKQQLHDGFVGFISLFYTVFNSHVPSILLGLLLNTQAVSIYKVGNCIVKFTSDILDPFIEAWFPMVDMLHATNVGSWYAKVKKILCCNIVVTTSISVLCHIFSDLFVSILCGHSHDSDYIHMASSVFRMCCFLPVIMSTCWIMGMLFLKPSGYGTLYTTSLYISCIVSVALNVVLIPKITIFGPVYATLCANFIELVILLYYAYKKIDDDITLTE